MTAWIAVLLPLASAILGAVVGGLVVHRLSLVREIRGARRSQRVDYLISAYRRLIDAANRPEGLTNAQKDDLEAAFSDVVLLGEAEEVDAARDFMVSLAQSNRADLDSLIKALRNSLREELELSPLELPHPYNLRMDRTR